MYYVYILTNFTRETMYIGVTNNLYRRYLEHKMHKTKGFTDKYNVNVLVHYETFADVSVAIAREKELKHWVRRKKNALVEEKNPEWVDLSKELFRSDEEILKQEVEF